MKRMRAFYRQAINELFFVNNAPGFYVSADCWTGDAAASASSSDSAHFSCKLFWLSARLIGNLILSRTRGVDADDCPGQRRAQPRSSDFLRADSEEEE